MIQSPTINPIQPGGISPAGGSVPAGRTRGRDTEFARELTSQLNSREITLSLHAADRLVRRGLTIDESMVDRINQAFDMAEQKGAKNALFLLDDLAVVASIANRSITTAMDARNLSNGVFTQIDSAVILPRNDTQKTNETITVNHDDGRSSAEEALVETGAQKL